MDRRSGLAFAAIGCVFAVGCGGGAGGGTTSTTPTGSEFAFGEISGRAAISNPPVTTSSQYVVGTAFTGTFSSLKIRELNPTLSETRIVASSDLFGSGLGLVNYSINGDDAQKITSPATLDVTPSVSSTGKIVFARVISGPSAFQPSSIKAPIVTPSIQMINMDGTGLTQLAPAGFSPSIDSAADKIAFEPDGSDITVENTSTKATTALTLPASSTVESLVMSPDGNTVYAMLDESGTTQAFALPAAGGPPPFSFTTSFGTNAFSGMAVSPDGSELALLENGSPAQVILVGTGGGEQSSPIPMPSGNANGISFSADGQSVAVGTSGTDPNGLYIVNLTTNAVTRITSETSTTEYPAWTPFIKDRTLIAGGGGLLGTRACGVILGQRVEGATSSVVAFDVTTPSSVVMTAQAGSLVSTTNLVFSIDADNITKLAYANTYNWRGIRAIGSGTPVTSANGALVSIDGVSGQVVSLLPFSGTRAVGSKPTIKDMGTIRTITGNFLAVYDKNGNNIAPNGAAVVTIDTKTDAVTLG